MHMELCYLRQDSNKVWAENIELGIIQKDVVAVEAVGSAENAQCSQVVTEEEKSDKKKKMEKEHEENEVSLK